MTFGVTPTGFNIKRLQDILISLNANMVTKFGPEVDNDPDKPNGQVIGIMAAVFAELWEVAEATYDARDPTKAFGIALRDIGVINYLTALNATRSTVEVTLTGTIGITTFIPAAIAKVSTTNPVSLFHFLTDVTIPIGGIITVQMEADETGPIVALAGTLSTIQTPISGWLTATNAQDAVLGRNLETDPEYRIRRNNSTSLASQQVEDGILAGILALSGVIDASVTSNNLNVDDSNGNLPHSLIAVVEGGEDIQIAQVIYSKLTSSIPTNGETQVLVQNTAGMNIPINFYSANQLPVYITISVQAYSGFPGNGVQQIQQNVFNYLQTLNPNGTPLYGIGDTIVLSQLYTPINYTPGVSVISIKAGFSANPLSTANLPIPFNGIGTFDINHIVVQAS